MLERPIHVEVEAELGQLDRDLAVEAARRDRVEEAEVVLRDRVGLVGTGHVLAETGEHRRDALVPELVRGRERGLGGPRRA